MIAFVCRNETMDSRRRLKVLFQRHVYLSLVLCLQCAFASAQSRSGSIKGNAELDRMDGAASFASSRNEVFSDDTAELEARLQRREAERSQ